MSDYQDMLDSAPSFAATTANDANSSQPADVPTQSTEASSEGNESREPSETQPASASSDVSAPRGMPDAASQMCPVIPPPATTNPPDTAALLPLAEHAPAAAFAPLPPAPAAPGINLPSFIQGNGVGVTKGNQTITGTWSGSTDNSHEKTIRQPIVTPGT